MPQAKSGGDDTSTVYHCLELFKIPRELLHSDFPLGKEKAGSARDVAVSALIQKSDGPFAPDRFNGRAEISFVEEAAVILLLLVVMGGPLFWFLLVLPCGALFGTAAQNIGLFVLTLVLAFHPMPPIEYRAVFRSFITISLYKYFSYRFFWTDDLRQKAQEMGPWIGAGVPHGVLPFANVLSTPAINSISFLPSVFLGAPASVVFHTPFLRYLLLTGPCCSVGKESLMAEIKKGNYVGLVPDGIAGIFRCNEEDETVFLKDRKGLAKLSLRTGAAILPAYSLGNTEAFSCWYDSWGIMERLSRSVQASVFIYWGRFYLPIPRRTPIALLIGDPIGGGRRPVKDPSREQIGELHAKLLDGIRNTFNSHKTSLGWGHKRIRFV